MRKKNAKSEDNQLHDDVEESKDASGDAGTHQQTPLPWTRLLSAHVRLPPFVSYVTFLCLFLNIDVPELEGYG
jgi:hypothetical protein